MKNRVSSGISQNLLKEESILEGPFWPKRIRVISTRQISTRVEVGRVSIKSKQFFPVFQQKVILTASQGKKMVARKEQEALNWLETFSKVRVALLIFLGILFLIAMVYFCLKRDFGIASIFLVLLLACIIGYVKRRALPGVYLPETSRRRR